MKLCVVGTGYVGLVAGTCLAEMGNEVVCVDNNMEKLAMLSQGKVPIYEPGLEDLIKNNVLSNRLSFSSDLKMAVEQSQVCFIAVGTPQNDDGSANLDYVFQVAQDIAKYMNGYKVVVDKSTVPVGTGEKIADVIRQNTCCDFDVVSNPEFLKQGAAVEDFLKPDRVIIGADSDRAAKIMQEIYAPFVLSGNPVLIMDVKSAEMSKYAANSFLAAKISFANEIANICEKVGADAQMVRKGMCLDSRIGNKFLYPGLGYGGSCFPKDVQALMHLASDNGYQTYLLNSVNFINTNQRTLFVDKIRSHFGNNIKDKTFAVWGLAFKPQTNDMRESPSITIINELLKSGAKVQAFDPKAMETAFGVFGDKIKYTDNNYAALSGADALLLLTEWNEFRKPDFDKVKSLMKTPVLFDGRNQYDGKSLIENGFDYYCIGTNYRKDSLCGKKTLTSMMLEK